MLNYQIALCNVFWDEQNIDTRYFDSVAKQTQYFEQLTEGVYTPFRNDKWGNGVELSLVYTENTGRSIQEVLHCNYAVIKELDDEGNTLNYRYYFAYPRHDAGNNYIVDLSLDDIQTNYFKYKQTIAPCLIKRACIPRFYPNPDNPDEVVVNMREGDPFIQSDGIDTVKVLKQRLPIKFKWTLIEEIDEWLFNNVLGWVYIFCDKTKKYKNEGGEFENFTQTELKSSEFINNDYGIFAYPIYKKTGLSSVRTPIVFNVDGVKYSWGESSETYLRGLNNDSSYFFTKKVSIVPPLRNFNNTSYNFVDGRLEITVSGLDTSNSVPFADGYITILNSRTNNLIIMHSVRDYDRTTLGYVDGLELPPTVINKSEYELADTIYPPLYSGNYMNLRLKGLGGIEFNYDLFKIGNNPIEFEYSEAITPTITKYYLRLKPVGFYATTLPSTGGNDTNYLGLVGSIDTTIAVSNDQYASFLANNKNFWLQTTMKVVDNVVNPVAQGLIGGQPVGGLTGGARGLINSASELLNSTLSLDNLKNAPDAFSNASGDIIFNGKVDTLGFYVELWDSDEYSKQINSLYFKQFGFKYNLLTYIFGVDNIRNRFNYVSAEVGVISAPISEIEKERLRNKLSSIRFWKKDEINYIFNNLEKYYWED